MQSPNTVSNQELKRVIADFLDMGHVENIVAMFRHEPRYYAWTGDLLRDERFSVRLGMSVLFEELRESHTDHVERAIPSLVKLLDAEEPLLRGEAVSILGIIGSDKALAYVRQQHDDPSPRVREVVELVLQEKP
ncbi:MAG TPA: HEAT repeat domain-containing protein [Desulfobulbaceae bacterium]|nr:HEAT repeat domain-containing protein [Desulfobulbaceae bacterium]